MYVGYWKVIDPVGKKKKKNMTPPPLHTHTYRQKSWGYMDFKMAIKENALTQPKFELEICAVIQNVFQGN